MATRRQARFAAERGQDFNFPPIKRLENPDYCTASSFCARASRLATLETCQRDPRDVGIFRSFSDRVIAPIVIAPSARKVRSRGSSSRACSSAAAISDVRPASPASRMLLGLPSLLPLAFLICQRRLGALRDQPPLLLGQRGVEVQHERIGVAAEFGDDERHALRHQAGDERDVARQPVQLRDQDAALRGLGRSQRGCELRPPVERVGALAGFGLDVLGDDR